MGLRTPRFRQRADLEADSGAIQAVYDGSDGAKRELRAACRVAERNGADLVVQLRIPRKILWYLAVGAGLTETPVTTPLEWDWQLRREVEREIEAVVPAYCYAARILVSYPE